MKRSKRTPVAFVLAAACALVAAGCSTIVSTQAYVQDAAVSAPAGTLPVHLAWDARPGTLTVTPSLSVGRKELLDGRVDGHTNVNARGIYAVDTVRAGDGSVALQPGNNPYAFTGSNLHWTPLPVVAGLSVDVPLSRSFAVSGGLTYAGEASNGGLWGGYLAMGLLSEGPVLGMRIETGVQMTPTAYDVNSIVETTYEPAFSSSQYTRTRSYDDQDNGAPMGWFAGMTLNTRVPDWPVQPFVNLTLSKQQFFSFEPSVPAPLPFHLESSPSGDSHVKAAATVLLFSPGLALAVGPSQRILLGTRMAFLPDWANGDALATPSTHAMVAPFIQIDVGL